jgi:predicted Ser/Thr protein kinase
MSLEDYLAECKRNPLAYATAAERMLRAIGEPQSVDTRNDPRLSACSPTRSSRSTRPSPSSTAWKTPSSRW